MSADVLATLLCSAEGRIRGAYEDALRVYHEDKGDWNAGRVDGLKQALELIAETLPKG